MNIGKFSIGLMMARLALLACTVGLAVPSRAADKFNPLQLSEWGVSDGIPAPDVSGRGVVLPAGVQIFRSFAARRVDLHVVSKPVFSSQPAEWATIEIGPASLTFVQDAVGGGMVLLGDEPLSLPFALPLDAQGRSLEPVDLVLHYDQARGTATLTVQKVDFDIEASAGQGRTEVAISAGRKAAWTLSQVELKVVAEPAPDGLAGNAGGGDGDAGAVARVSSSREQANSRKEAGRQARLLFLGDDDAAGEKALTSTNRNPRNSAEWHLETANELVQTAFSLSRAGKPQKAAQLGRRALEHLDKAVRKSARQANSAGLAAAAEQTAAFIQERLLADYGNAKSFYLRASLRQPQGNATGELRRIERLEREARRKAGEAVMEPGIDAGTSSGNRPPPHPEDGAVATATANP